MKLHFKLAFSTLLHSLSNLLYALKHGLHFLKRIMLEWYGRMGIIFLEDLNFLKKSRNFLQTKPKWRFSKRKFHEVFVLNLPVKWENCNYQLTFWLDVIFQNIISNSIFWASSSTSMIRIAVAPNKRRRRLDGGDGDHETFFFFFIFQSCSSLSTWNYPSA